MPTRTSSFRPRAPALLWLPPARAEPLRRAAVASCLCQSRCRGSRDGAPSAGAEPVWRRCEVQLLLLRDGGAGDEFVLPVAAGAGAPPAGAEPACQLPAEPASRERRRFGSSYARTGMERVWPLCVECKAMGKRNSCSGDGNHPETEGTDKAESVFFYNIKSMNG